MNWANTLTRPLTWMGIGAVIVGGAVWAQTNNRSLPPRERTTLSLTPALTSTAGTSTLSPNAMEDVFVTLAERASQAVVHITSDTRGLANAQRNPSMMGGEGSGFVYRSDGWIVTNEHVVAGKKEVRVILADGREVLGKVTTANDPQLDLAVVKVEEKGLPTLAFATTKTVKPGQYAIAVGAPFGLENSVTVGHVSAISRQGTVNDPSTGIARGYTGMIQTDASINPGNSGGPLLNLNGEVIGINTSIYSTSGGNNGIGFAIPSRVVKEVADELISKGKFDRGLLGVVPRDLKPFERKERGVTSGALLTEVPEDSGAFAAGIRSGDIIVKVNNAEVTDELDLRVAAYRHSPGETVNITYLRGKETRNASVKLGKPTDLAQQQSPRQVPDLNIPDGERFFRMPFGQEDGGQTPAPAVPGEKPKLGVSVQNIDATLRSQFKLGADVQGVVVLSVEPGSFAARLGIKPGDVLKSIDSKPLNSVTDVSAAMADVQWGDQISLAFERYSNGKKSTFTTIVPFSR